jgi:tripartite-type tricarboxylate transporter receptor subunit TctC
MRKRLFIALLSLLSAFGVFAAYPDKPITVLVGFPPGSAPDIAARLITDKLSSRIGQAIVVENRSGAAGTIAASALARAPADGYTLMFGSSSTLAIAPALYKNLPFDPVKLTPVIQAVRGPFILTVRSELPVHDLKELVAYASERPGKLTYGSSGNGSVHHLCMEMLKSSAGLDIVHVPFKGGPPDWLAFDRGDVDMICDSMPNPAPALQSGRGRAVAITGDQRSAILPNVATFKEQGRPDVDIEFWYGFVAPPGMPADVVNTLNRAITAVLRDPEIISRNKVDGIEMAPGTPENFGRLIAAEVKKWPPIIEKAHVKIN